MATKLTDVRKVQSFVVIIRCIHERGQSQDDAFAELKRRGLWLTPEQMSQAGRVS